MKSRQIVFLLPIVIAFVAGPLKSAPQNAFTLDQVLTKMGEIGKTFRSMQADVERTKVTVIVNDRYTDYGTVHFARRGTESRIKFDIIRPEQQRVLFDKGKALLYFPKLKQVQEYTMGKNQDKAEFLLVGFGQSSESIKEFYNVTLAGEEVINGQKTSIVDLKPKSVQAKAMFANIRLWIEHQRWIPIQSQTTEAGGDYMIYKFANLKMNLRIPDSVFDLKLPKDVQVIKM